MERAALSFSCVVNLEMNNSLKWLLFNIVRWGIVIENLTVFFYS